MVNYPLGQGPRRFNRQNNKPVNYASRGMSLEDKLNDSNQYYRSHNIAVIHKKPTPIQVVKVNYPKRSAARITEAYYRQASTTDYNGVYKGFYIDFEAKETRNKKSFPLANLPEHQIEHMKTCVEHGGLAFLILSFSKLNEIYLLPYEEIERYLTNNDKQSLAYDFVAQAGYLCPLGVFPLVDYLAAVDRYLLAKERK